MTKRIYAVHVSKATVAMVLADNQFEAVKQAQRDATEILRDCPLHHEIDVLGPMQSQAELTQHHWDADCLPYGGDGNTRLSELLPA